MLLRYKKQSDILTAFFTSMEHWAKRLFVRFGKGGLLAELQARMQIFAIFGSQLASILKFRANESYCLYDSGPMVRHYAFCMASIRYRIC